MADLWDTIGEAAPGDFVIDPLGHATLYKTTSPTLAGLLGLAIVKASAESYNRLNAEAIDAQRSYKKWMLRANVGVFATTVLGACAMAAAIIAKSDFASGLPDVGRPISVVAALAAALSAYCLYMLREGRLMESWMEARAGAETHRLEYFTVLAYKAREAADPVLLSLVLEYFRRYQLDVQKNYYDSRRHSHQASAIVTLRCGGIGAAVATLSSLASVAPDLEALGAFSVAGAALGAFAAARELMNQDRRNSERYQNTLQSLVGVGKRLDDVRKAAAQGNGEAVAEFVAAVNEQISVEHRQWLETGESSKQALSRLEAALANFRKPEAEGEPTTAGGGPSQ